MFTFNRSLERLDVPASDVVTLLVSTNRPIVSVSAPSQQADAFIISFKKGKAQPVLICFHIIKEKERLFYTTDKDPTSEGGCAGLEEEAVRFVEDMGFMMVQERLDGFTPEKKHDFLMNLAPFADDLAGLAKDNAPGRRTKEEREQAAEEATEYEDVYEEVIEEVPVEETPAKPEEYESLSDIVHEVSAEERPAARRPDPGEQGHNGQRQAGKGVKEQGEGSKGRENREGKEGKEEKRGKEKAETFDLANEISEEVASIGKMPQRTELEKEDRNGKPGPAEQEVIKNDRIEAGKHESIVRLLISL